MTVSTYKILQALSAIHLPLCEKCITIPIIGGNLGEVQSEIHWGVSKIKNLISITLRANENEGRATENFTTSNNEEIKSESGITGITSFFRGGGVAKYVRSSSSRASSYVKISSWTQWKMPHFQTHPFCITMYGLLWSSPVLVYPYNSLCSHVGEMHCKASNEPVAHQDNTGDASYVETIIDIENSKTNQEKRNS